MSDILPGAFVRVPVGGSRRWGNVLGRSAHGPYRVAVGDGLEMVVAVAPALVEPAVALVNIRWRGQSRALTTEPFVDRGEAWRRFMALGCDPAVREVFIASTDGRDFVNGP